MTTPHKHADVLRAIADGKAVQWKTLGPGGWRDYVLLDEHDWSPCDTSNPLEWRIKPEPKPDVVTYHSAYPSIGYETIEAANKHAVHPDRKGVYRLIYDGETRKLKSAEVLP